MNIEIDNVENLIDGRYLTECIAEQIVRQKKDNFGDFDNELLKGIKLVVKQIVKEYMANYFGEQGTRRLIKEELHEMTREEIIKAL